MDSVGTLDTNVIVVRIRFYRLPDYVRGTGMFCVAYGFRRIDERDDLDEFCAAFTPYERRCTFRFGRNQ